MRHLASLWLFADYPPDPGTPQVVPNDPSAWSYVFTHGLFLVVFGALFALSLWGLRRRRRGNEASTNAEGAEAIRLPPTNA